VKANLEPLVDRLAGLARRDPARCPKVVVTGDFFMRLNPSFMPGVYDLYAQHGIILVPVNFSELLLYGAYSDMATAAGDWGVPVGSLRAAATACLKLFQPEGRNYLASWIKYWRLRQYEAHYRKQFERTGLLAGGLNDMRSIFEHASRHISPAIFGEAIPIVGKGATAVDEGYRGMIVIGPFNCLPLRISEAILKPVSLHDHIPILTYESDGFSVPPAFLRQVEVHIQQVLAERVVPRASQGELEQAVTPNRKMRVDETCARACNGLR
jgi:hypothetical protein